MLFSDAEQDGLDILTNTTEDTRSILDVKELSV